MYIAAHNLALFVMILGLLVYLAGGIKTVKQPGAAALIEVARIAFAMGLLAFLLLYK